jgi:uncharacterized protein (DUF2237 family)
LLDQQAIDHTIVFNKPLHIFSTKPMTGAYKDGFCRTGKEDEGVHTVAATVTKEFLDFTGSKGNSLAKNSSVTPGTKWCLCVHRFKEAVDAAKDANDPIIPKVHLHATGKETLDVIGMDELKKYAAEGEAGGSGGSASGRAPRGMAGMPKKQTVHEMNTTGGIARDANIDESDKQDETTHSKMYSGRRAT